ncbi:MAG TPA: M28 family peptidase [Thermoanaerobaculia bacterium]
MRTVLIWLAVVAAFVLVVAIVVASMVSMPGRSHQGELPPLTLPQQRLATTLRDDVAFFATESRNIYEETHLAASAARIRRTYEAAGYRVNDVAGNLEVELRGATKPDEIVVIGAHYDSIDESPGADDNASGVAALLALAQRMAKAQPARTLRFVAFINEEPPHFKTEEMGSWQYARHCHQKKEKIVAMLSLEMLGYYTTEPGSQQYPQPLSYFYPDTGDFIAFAGNLGSRSLVRTCVGSFREHAQFPSVGAVLPGVIQEIGWSDQWSFWQFGWPGIMVTDTALFRNPHYHAATDTPQTLDYERMARVVEGLERVVGDLVGER